MWWPQRAARQPGRADGRPEFFEDEDFGQEHDLKTGQSLEHRAGAILRLQPDSIMIDGFDHGGSHPGDSGIRFELDPARQTQ